MIAAPALAEYIALAEECALAFRDVLDDIDPDAEDYPESARLLDRFAHVARELAGQRTLDLDALIASPHLEPAA